MNMDQIIRECSAKMAKTVEYYDKELRGIRTGRASTALIEYIKVDYYGNPTDIRELAAVSVTEATQLFVKPFDPGAKNDIVKAIEKSGLGLNPMVEGAAIRINVPAPSAERRKQLTAQVKKLGEDSKVAIRNERRDAIKHIDTLIKDKTAHISEDVGKAGKEQIESITKKHIESIDQHAAKKTAEINEV